MSFEKLGEFEQTNITGKELPQSHLEGINPAQFENMNNIDRIKLMGEQVFTETVETQAGIRGAFEEVAQEGTKEEFVKYYEQYVMNPQELQREKPEIYDFFYDRINQKYIIDLNPSKFNVLIVGSFSRGKTSGCKYLCDTMMEDDDSISCD